MTQQAMRPRQLEDAIEGLYTAFAHYPLADDTGPCGCDGCRHPQNANELLHAAPLRELQWEHLAIYSSAAIMVWGDVHDFKHFLPRILDLLLQSVIPENVRVSPNTVFGIIEYGEWHTWPQEEQAAVKATLKAILTTVLANPPITSGYVKVEEWICCIGQCEDDLSPYLQQWLDDQNLSAAWALSSLILDGAIAYRQDSGPRPQPTDSPEALKAWFHQPRPYAYWKSRETQYDRLRRWVCSPESLEKLHQAELTCDAPEIQRELATAQRCLVEAPTTKFAPAYRDRAFQSAYWKSTPGRHRLY